MDSTARDDGAAIVEPHPLTRQDLTCADELKSCWNRVDVLTLPRTKTSPYTVGFAVSDRCVEAALRLRYEVFNLELGEGFATAAVTGLDRDEYDEQMTHIVLLEGDTSRVVGTYRIQTMTRAQQARGIYAAQFFDLTDFAPYMPKTVELGRACLAHDHRTLAAIITLWMGVGGFANLFDHNYLFGCCSLTSQDPDDGWRALKTIRAQNHLHATLRLPAKAHCRCGDPSRENDPGIEAIRLPKLFRTYLRLGCEVISEPVIDREFGTVDFLILMNGREVNFSRLDVIK
ncbi:MAG: GNAT family N-acetyltransferase [Candidatus Hydrogenedentes bacterium]|nr:GNAT family N-acetyltransferase [Candidatus Hydrogenedentota bacterium]